MLSHVAPKHFIRPRNPANAPQGMKRTEAQAAHARSSGLTARNLICCRENYMTRKSKLSCMQPVAPFVVEWVDVKRGFPHTHPYPGGYCETVTVCVCV